MSNRKSGYVDMEKFRITRNNQKNRYYAKTAIYPSRRWTKEEDERVLAHEIPDMKLSALICRSVKSIQIRRTRLKHNAKEEIDK